MKKCFSIFLLFLIAAESAFAIQAPGYVCDNCISHAAAVQEATTYAPGLSCTNPFTGPLQCTSTPKNIVLTNLAENQIYPFLVRRDTTPPFTIHVENLTLPSVQYNNFVTAIEVINAINDGFDAIYDDWNPSTGRFNSSNFGSAGAVSDENATTRDNVPSHCPTGTALEALTNDTVMSNIIESAKNKIRGELFGINPGAGNATSSNVSIGYGGLAGSISSSSNNPLIPDSVKFTFFTNELGISSFDHIAFSVRVLLSIQEPILTLELGASRIFGQTASRVLGGIVNITDECALARLAAIPQNRPGSELRVGGDVVDTSDGFPGGGAGGAGGSTPNFCTYDLYQNGGYQYSFRASCI